MATLTVGSGQDYATIAAAVAASSSSDTIAVSAGTYVNDFVTITHDLSLTAVGGTVTMVATQSPPNGKAMIDEGGSGVSVSITGFDISGVAVADGNGAAIRYEGGTLTLDKVNLHDNQEGILAAADPAGSITITDSTIADNGSGTGYTHNIYVGAISSLTVRDSTISGAVGGHDIKSRAATTTLTGNTIIDGDTGTGSYEIDLPNGGVAVIQGNVIQKGDGATNPVGISYGEEGVTWTTNSLTVQGNVILNDDTGASTTAIRNAASSVTATVSGNEFYGWTAISSGSVSVSGNTTLTTEPDLDSLVPGGGTTVDGSGGTGSGDDGSDPSTPGTGTPGEHHGGGHGVISGGTVGPDRPVFLPGQSGGTTPGAGSRFGGLGAAPGDSLRIPTPPAAAYARPDAAASTGVSTVLPVLNPGADGVPVLFPQR